MFPNRPDPNYTAAESWEAWNIFYDKTLGYAVTPYQRSTPYISSFIASFPQNTADPGPGMGLAPGGDLYRLIEVTPGGCPANPRPFPYKDRAGRRSATRPDRARVRSDAAVRCG